MIPSPSPDNRGSAPSMPPRAIHVVHDQGRLGARCEALLSEAGVPMTTASAADPLALAPPSGAVVLLATDRPRPELAARLDTEAWHAGIAWTSGTMIAHEFRVGPSIVPGRTPCFECWSRRVRSVVLDLDAFDALDTRARSDAGAPWFRGLLAPLTEQAAALLAAEALRLAQQSMEPETHSGRTPLGLVWEGDAVAGALQVRRYARIAVCPRCSAGAHSTTCGTALVEYFRRHPLAISATLTSERSA